MYWHIVLSTSRASRRFPHHFGLLENATSRQLSSWTAQHIKGQRDGFSSQFDDLKKRKQGPKVDVYLIKMEIFDLFNIITILKL